MKKIISLFIGIILSVSLFAQAPQKMSYQAVIRDASNNLVINHAIGLRISILQGTISGTEVFKENYVPNPQTNENGLVTIAIGMGTPVIGTFSGIDWANGPYFIKTEVDPTGGSNYTITGTSELMSVPYALFSLNGTPGPKGEPGTNGVNGKDGATPVIGADGYWYTNGIYTGVKAVGANGTNGVNGINGINGTNGATPVIGADGYWYINGFNTNVKATGAKGDKGDTGNSGYTPYIQNGYWYLNGFQMTSGGQPIKATPDTWTIGADGYWYVNGTKTTVRASGSVVQIGGNGNWYIDGVDTGVKAGN